MYRKWALGLGAAASVLVLAACQNGGGAADAARAFFASIPSGGAPAAYAKAAPAFRNATSADVWAATAAQHNLTQYASSTWHENGDNGDVVTLNGVLTLKDGGAEPATVKMVKGANGWSVFSLDLPSGGVAGADANATAPAPAAAGVGADSAGTPVAPSGAPSGPTYADGQPGAPQSADAGAPPAAPLPGAAPGYPPAPGYASAPGQSAPGQGAYGQGGAVTLVPGRIAHDCGPQLLRLPGVQTIDVHCANGMAAAPGARGQCQAMVNGQTTNVSVTVTSYDPARDDAELACRLY